MLENEADNTIEELAQSVSKPISQTGEFDDMKELKDIGISYQLYRELNGKAKNQKGQFKLAGDQQIVVYEIMEIKEPYIKPLEDVKEQVRYHAMQEKKENLAKQKIGEYESSIKSLAAFDSLAKKLKTKTQTISFKFSDGQVGDLRVGNRFKTDVFRMEKGQIKAIKDSDKGYLVYMIEKKKGELNSESMATLRSLENMMQNQKSQIVLNGLIKKLQLEIEIDYNMPLLNSMNVKLDS